MAKTKLPIHIYRGSKLLDDQTVMIGEAHLRRWKLPAGTPVALQFGSTKQDIRFVSVTGLTAMRVSETLAYRMGLFDGLQLQVNVKSGGRSIRIGPLIGVLLRRIHQRDVESPFGAMTAFCREMTEACRLHGGHVCFFSPDDLPDANSDSMSAWTYQEHWIKRDFPIPDVVYNRLTARRLENDPTVQQFMKDIRTRFGATVFNEKYLDKTEVFSALVQDPALHHYLPESHLFKNFQMLKTMLDRHGIAFLKPITGSLGKGIIRISKTEDGTIALLMTDLNGIRRQLFTTLALAFQAISGKLRQQKYQIQQGLRLMEIDGRPLDFRSLVQKGRAGEWKVTSIVARIAAGGSFVSNIARGGTISPVKEALTKSNLTPGTRAGLIEKLRKASIDIAQGVETRIPAHFGELGIDLAADQNGRVWLLEVNSKPSKDDNTQLAEGKIRPSVRRLIEYAQYLGKFEVIPWKR